MNVVVSTDGIQTSETGKQEACDKIVEIEKLDNINKHSNEKRSDKSENENAKTTSTTSNLQSKEQTSHATNKRLSNREMIKVKDILNKK